MVHKAAIPGCLNLLGKQVVDWNWERVNDFLRESGHSSYKASSGAFIILYLKKLIVNPGQLINYYTLSNA